MFWRKLEKFLRLLEQFCHRDAKKIYHLRRYCIRQIRKRDHHWPEYERLLWEAQTDLPVKGFRGGWEWMCQAKNKKEYEKWMDGMNELIHITKMELFGSSLVDSFTSDAIEAAHKLGCSGPPTDFIPRCFFGRHPEIRNVKFSESTVISCPWKKKKMVESNERSRQKWLFSRKK